MTDWTPLFADGQDPVPGNPEDVEAMQRWLRSMSDEVGNSVRALAHVDVSAEWGDHAATRFSAGLDELRKDLPKLQSSFDRAAWGMWQYAAALPEAKAKAQQALSMALDAGAQTQSAQRTRAVVDPGQDTSAYDQLESDARHLYTRAVKLATDAHHDHDQAAHLLIRVLEDAGDIGIHNHSFWGDVWGGITGAAKDVWNSPAAYALPGLGEVKATVTGAAFALDPVDEISTWSADLGAILGVAALVIAPIPGLDFLDAVLGPAAMALSGIGLAADTVRVAEGRTDWKSVAVTGLLTLGTFGVGRWATGAAEVWRGREALEAARALDAERVNFQMSLHELRNVRVVGGDVESAESHVRGALQAEEHARRLADSTRTAKWLYTSGEGVSLADKLAKTAYAVHNPGEVAGHYADMLHWSPVSSAVRADRWDFGQRLVGAAYGGDQSWAAHHDSAAEPPQTAP